MRHTRLLLIRHAEVEANFQKVFGGRVGMVLSPRGRAQAGTLADFLRPMPLDAIYASPMLRVRETLAPLLGDGVPRPVESRELREVDFGDWTGHGWGEVREKFGISAYDWLLHLENGTIPNGESGKAFRQRVEPCLNDILQKQAGQAVAIFCHGGVIRMILSILLALPLSKMNVFEIDYASVTEVSLAEDRTEIRLLNFTPWRDWSR